MMKVSVAVNDSEENDDGKYRGVATKNDLPDKE